MLEDVAIIGLFSILAATFSRIRVSHSNLEEDPDAVKDVFRQYLSNIVANLAQRRDQEELSIVNN